MDSAHTGETTLHIGAQALTLVYDWRALSALHHLKIDVQSALGDADPETLAAIVAAGLARHHPEWTAEKVIDASPPLLAVTAVVVKAIMRAFYGAEALPAADPTPPAPVT